LLEDALRAAREATYDAAIADAASALALVMARRGATGEMDALLDEGLGAARRAGTAVTLGPCLIRCARAALEAGQPARARPWLEEACAVAENMGDANGLIRAARLLRQGRQGGETDG
jgi:hypothetical protein